MARPPYIVGGAALLAGYGWAVAVGRERVVSTDLVEFNRSEQIARLKAIVFRRERRT
jgi:hypothetical protein